MVKKTDNENENDTKLIEKAKQVVSDVMGYLDIDAQVKIMVEETEGKQTIKIDVAGGDELGRLIGRMGKNLSAIQTVLAILINKGLEAPVFVSLDVNEYRLKREETLRQMADKAAEIVKKTGEAYEMAPMDPADRRIVHMALAEDKELSTDSVGEGFDRRIVVKLAVGVEAALEAESVEAEAVSSETVSESEKEPEVEAETEAKCEDKDKEEKDDDDNDDDDNEQDDD
jgi:predicted RNA-binding protein Jag